MEILTFCFWVWLTGAAITFGVVLVSTRDERTPMEDKLIMATMLAVFWVLFLLFMIALYGLIRLLFLPSPPRPKTYRSS